MNSYKQLSIKVKGLVNGTTILCMEEPLGFVEYDERLDLFIESIREFISEFIIKSISDIEESRGNDCLLTKKVDDINLEYKDEPLKAKLEIARLAMVTLIDGVTQETKASNDNIQ